MAFSLKHLMFAVLVAAIGLAALINADRPFVEDFIKLGTFAIIVVTGYGIWTSTAELRAFRIGFVAWAGFYFAVAAWFHVNMDFGVRDLIALASRWLRPERITTLSGRAYRDAMNTWGPHFYTISKCLLSLLLGLIGGCVTIYFYRKRQRMQKTQS